MKKLSVVIPTLNERNNLDNSVKALLSQQSKLKNYQIEIIITDSHSTDGTMELGKKLAQQNKHIHFLEVGRGIGVGLITGHKYALEHIHPDVLAQMDADGQVGWDVLPKLVAAIEEGYTLALGSRFVKGGVNELSFRRKFFTSASSFVCRLLMGPWDIKEFTNSARAFTPELFEKINLDRLPWKEKTFINQPAFLHEAVLSGAKYKEVPLVFKNRAEGYSKNKTIAYTYDVITYSIGGFLERIGINIPFFKWSRKAKLFYKFGTVGLIGTIIDYVLFRVFMQTFHLMPFNARLGSASIAVVNNFTLNNIWTFKGRKVSSHPLVKFITFVIVSVVGVLIGAGMVGGLHLLYGEGTINMGLHLHYSDLFFLLSIIPMMTWNFLANHFITWREHKN